MTLKEIEQAKYLKYDTIADRFKDLQMQSNALKNPEDEIRTLNLLTRIADDVTDIKKLYTEIKDLDDEIPEKEVNNFKAYLDDDEEHTSLMDFLHIKNFVNNKK